MESAPRPSKAADATRFTSLRRQPRGQTFRRSPIQPVVRASGLPSSLSRSEGRGQTDGKKAGAP